MKRYQIVSIAVSIIIVISAILMGCDTEAQASSYSDSGRMKEARYLDSIWFNVEGHLVIDTQTGVEYWYIEHAGDSGGYSLTLLVDQDGKPLVWKGE